MVFPWVFKGRDWLGYLWCTGASFDFFVTAFGRVFCEEILVTQEED